MESHRLKAQKLLGRGISQRRQLSLSRQQNMLLQQELKELERNLESSSSNNLRALLERQRGLDNGW